MTVLQICSPSSHERADGSLTRGVDAEGGSPLNTRDGAVENDRATIPETYPPYIGITATPVIDVAENTMYVVAFSSDDGLIFATFADSKRNPEFRVAQSPEDQAGPERPPAPREFREGHEGRNRSPQICAMGENTPP
jgi:hypothetical protein